MSLEQLHLKVRSLVSKAAPGPWMALTEINARDAFLAALGDDELKSRIMMTCTPPETLASVYDLALRAFNISGSRKTDHHDRDALSQLERKPRYARGVAQPTSRSTAASQQEESEVQELRGDNSKMKQKIADVEARLELLLASKRNRPDYAAKPPASASILTGNETKAYPARSQGECFCCGQLGHFARNCPNRTAAATGTTTLLRPQSRNNVIKGQR